MPTDLLCAATAGMVCPLIFHPLNTTKTVAFTGFSGECCPGNARGGIAAKNSFWGSAQSIYKAEGIPGFYRGVGVATLGSVPAVALYLTTYTWASGILQKHQDGALSGVPSSFIHLLCGFFAEMVSCVFWVPTDVIKERLQSQPPSQVGRYAGSWNALCTVARHEGLSGLYKGYGTTLASFGPYSAVYFACFETFKDIFSNHLLLNPFTSSLYAGGIGNIVASLSTNPLEFIKTRLQVQRAVLLMNGKPKTVMGYRYHYKGLVDGLSTVVREEGARALWHGVGSRILYSAPNAALTMAVYEYLRSL